MSNNFIFFASNQWKAKIEIDIGLVNFFSLKSEIGLVIDIICWTKVDTDVDIKSFRYEALIINTLAEHESLLKNLLKFLNKKVHNRHTFFFRLKFEPF